MKQSSSNNASARKAGAKGLRRNQNCSTSTPARSPRGARVLHDGQYEQDHPGVEDWQSAARRERGLRRTLEDQRAKAADRVRAPPPIHRFRGLHKNAPNTQSTNFQVPLQSTSTGPGLPLRQLRGLRKNAPNTAIEDEEGTDFDRTGGVETNNTTFEPDLSESSTELPNTHQDSIDVSISIPIVTMPDGVQIESVTDQQPNGDTSTGTPTALLQTPTTVTDSNLARANLVEHDLESQALQHAQQVDLVSVQQKKVYKHYLAIRNFILCIALTMLVVGVVSAVWYVALQNKGDHRSPTVPPSTIAPDTVPPFSSFSPSTAPSPSPTEPFEDLQVFYELPNQTQQNIVKVGTPQYHAWNWLQDYAKVVDFDNATQYHLQRKKELFALATFFYAFEGPNWPKQIRNDWLIKDPKRHECTWYNTEYTDVSSNANSVAGSSQTAHVPATSQCPHEEYTTEIYLADLYLAGYRPTIPPEISLLSSLEKLKLPDNFINVTLASLLPTELGLLSYFKWIDFDNNGITGTLPTELGLLSYFKWINFDNNGITGTLPTELALLSNLESLDLFHNAIIGTLPTELGLMSNLTYLSLQTNVLTGALPTELGLLSKLTDLILSFNALTGSLPTECGIVPTVYLSDNAFTGALPTELGIMSSLTWLDLEANTFTGTLPTELGRLSDSVVLNLETNALTGTLPVELLSHLETFYLSNNLLTGILPSQLGLLSRLSLLSLYNNAFTGTLPTQLGRMTSLSTIDLSGNSVTGTLPTELGLLPHLHELKLSENSLTGTLPTELGLPDYLYSVFLDSNGIFGTLPTELGLLSYLDVLNLANNAFKGALPTDLGPMLSLRRLFVANNALTGTVPTELGLMTGLNHLSLSNNAFSGTLPTELGLLYNLYRLDLSGLRLLTGTIPNELGDLVDTRQYQYFGYLNISGSSNLSGRIPEPLCYLQESSCGEIFQHLEFFCDGCKNCTLDFDCSDALCGCDCEC